MPIWLALVLAAAGTAVQYKQSKAVEKKQQGYLDAAEVRSKAKREAALAAIQQGADQFDPKTREANLDKAEAEQGATLSSALEQAAGDRSIGSIAQGTGGKVSEAYTTAKAGEEARQTREAINLSRMLAKVGGQGRLRQGEAQRTRDATTRAGVDWSSSRNFLDAGGQAASLIRPKAETALIASLLQSYGFGSLFGAGKGGKAAGTAATGYGVTTYPYIRPTDAGGL